MFEGVVDWMLRLHLKEVHTHTYIYIYIYRHTYIVHVCVCVGAGAVDLMCFEGLPLEGNWRRCCARLGNCRKYHEATGTAENISIIP